MRYKCWVLEKIELVPVLCHKAIQQMYAVLRDPNVKKNVQEAYTP